MKEKILDAISKPLSEINVSVYDITFEKEDGVDTLFIKLDSEETIDTDMCEKASEIINPIIDKLDLGIESEYVVDICSKGVTENE